MSSYAVNMNRFKYKTVQVDAGYLLFFFPITNRNNKLLSVINLRTANPIESYLNVSTYIKFLYWIFERILNFSVQAY